MGKSKNKPLLFFVFSLFALIALLLCAPTFISTDLGRKATIYFLNKKYSGKIQIEQLSLSWFGNQKIKGAQWNNKKEGLFFHCEEMTSSIPLWKLIFNHQIGHLKLISPQLEVDTHFSPSLTSQKVERDLQCGFFPHVSIDKSYFGNIIVNQGSVLVFSNNKPLASFQQVSAQANFPEDKFPIQVAIIGQTEQESLEGKFDIKAELNSLSFEEPNLEVQAKLVHFPIFGLDELLSYFDPTLKGFLTAMIGPFFDLDLDLKLQPQMQEVSMIAQSANFQAEVLAESSNGQLKLKTPAKLNFSIPPSLFEHFECLHPFSLKNAPELLIQIDHLALQSGFKWNGISFQSQITLSPSQLLINETNELVQLDALSCRLSSEQLEKELKIAADSSLKMEHLNTQISAKADLKNPFTSGAAGTAKFQVQEFPLKIVEHFLNEQLISKLGISFDGSFILNINPEASILSFKAATPLLKISEMQFRIDDKITMLQPIVADYHSSPRLAPIQLSIDRCVFPKKQWQQMQFDCHFQIPAIHHWIVDQLQGQIQINTLDNIRAKVAGQEIQMNCLLALNEELNKIELKEALTVDYLLTPAKFQTFFSSRLKNPLLLSPAHFHLMIEPFSAPLSGSLLKDLKTKAFVSVDTLSLQYEQQLHQLKNLQFQFSLDAPHEIIETSFKTEGQSLECKALVKSFKLDQLSDFSKCDFNVSLKADNFSLCVLESFLEKSDQLTTLCGPTLSLRLDAEGSSGQQSFCIDAKGKLIHLDTAFTVKNDFLELKKPLTLDWVLNEKGYALLDQWITKEKESPFELLKPAQFHLQVPKLSYFINDNDYSRLCLSSLLTMEQCDFTDRKKGSLISLESLKFNFEKNNQESPFSLDLKASVNKESKCLLKGTMKDIRNGAFNGQIQKFPTLLLDMGARFAGNIDFPFSTFFGDEVNAQISTELNDFTGPISLSLFSPNVRTSLTGAFDKSVLTLKEPLHAQILLTHKLSSLFLKEINPFSITSIESMHPVTLQIDAEGFSLPLSSDWQKLTIPNVHIELGQIFCKNEGNLNLTLGLLKQNQEQSSDLSLWFTPIDLHINDQLCNVERTEILINNSLEICTFGDIDLSKERVNMILGLTSQCLHKAFGIENLPPDYMLHIPLKGAMDNVKLDTKKATAKITTLLLWQKSGLASSVVGKNGAGALIGELIGKLATLPDKEVSSPPAKQPFPWDKNKTAKSSQSKPKKKCKIKKKEKPLKQLLKILT